jgi:hypothetical protein
LTGVADLVLGVGFLWGAGLLLTFSPLLEIRNGEPALREAIQRGHAQFIGTVHALGWFLVPLAVYALTRGTLELFGVWEP